MLLGLAAAWIVIAGMRELAGLVVPVFLALNLMIAVHPLGMLLTRRGVPRVVGALLNTVVVLVALGVFFAAIGWSIMQLVRKLPEYGNQFNDLLQSSLAQLSAWGVEQDQINAWISQLNFSSLLGLLNQTVSSIGAVGGLLAAAVAAWTPPGYPNAWPWSNGPTPRVTTPWSSSPSRCAPTGSSPPSSVPWSRRSTVSPSGRWVSPCRRSGPYCCSCATTSPTSASSSR
jgi:hypothetical protein